MRRMLTHVKGSFTEEKDVYKRQAVLSTHTGGLGNCTYRDLTDDMRAYAAHWKSLHLSFDALYTGFLGSAEQIDIVSEIVDDFRTSDTLVMVDPVMADNGKLYATCTPEMARGKMCIRDRLKGQWSRSRSKGLAAFRVQSNLRKLPPVDTSVLPACG